MFVCLPQENLKAGTKNWMDHFFEQHQATLSNTLYASTTKSSEISSHMGSLTVRTNTCIRKPIESRYQFPTTCWIFQFLGKDCSSLPTKICSEFPLDFFSHQVTETGVIMDMLALSSLLNRESSLQSMSILEIRSYAYIHDIFTRRVWRPEPVDHWRASRCEY